MHAPPALPTLVHLSMVHCALGVRDGSPQEAVWLQLASTLPQLESLSLALCSPLPPHSGALLRQLVAGGSLQRLSLQGCRLECGLGMLAAATSLTHLDLSGGLAGRCAL